MGVGHRAVTLSREQEGQTATVTAVNPERTWVQVIGFNDRYDHCWVPLDYVTLSGSLDSDDVINLVEAQASTITSTSKPSIPLKPTITPTNGPNEPTTS